MVGWLRALLLLVVAMSAQEIQKPKIKIVFPEGHSERASMTYAMHIPSGGSNSHFGMSMPSGDSFFEIRAATDRFKALVWAPGCEMKMFDVPIDKADTELEFVCDSLKTVTFFGRVKSVNIGESTTMEFRLDPSTLPTRLLRPESSSSPQFAVAPSYPLELSFVPVEWQSFPGNAH